MILEVKIIEIIPTGRSRHKSKKIIVYSCDVCGKRYEGKYQKQYLTSRKVTCCSRKCSGISRTSGGDLYKIIQESRDNVSWQLKLQQTVLKRYGVENISMLDEISQKKRETFTKNNCSTNEQKTKLYEKRKQGYLKKYGVEHSSLSKTTKEKTMNTCITRYGVSNFSQTMLFQKISRNFRSKHHRGHVDVKNKQMHFRSSYEKQFLLLCDKCENVIDIQQDINIPYFDGVKYRRYFADFLITTKIGKFLVEIKPESMLSYGLNPAKFAAANEYVKQNSSIVKFCVVTEFELKTGDSLWHVFL